MSYKVNMSTLSAPVGGVGRGLAGTDPRQKSWCFLEEVGLPLSQGHRVWKEGAWT